MRYVRWDGSMGRTTTRVFTALAALTAACGGPPGLQLEPAPHAFPDCHESPAPQRPGHTLFEGIGPTPARAKLAALREALSNIGLTAHAHLAERARLHDDEITVDFVSEIDASTRRVELRHTAVVATCRLARNVKVYLTIPDPELAAAKRQAHGTTLLLHSCHPHTDPACLQPAVRAAIVAAAGAGVRPNATLAERPLDRRAVALLAHREDAAYILEIHLSVVPGTPVRHPTFEEHYAFAGHSVTLWETRDARVLCSTTIDPRKRRERFKGAAQSTSAAAHHALQKALDALGPAVALCRSHEPHRDDAGSERGRSEVGFGHR